MLRTLQLRIDRPPSQGFTFEALQQRAELLRLSADLLTDAARRQDYEAALLSLSRDHPGETAGLELSFTREVAGVMLLWEASAPHEAYQLARQALQPPQAPALGSNREADLALLAALACRDAARQDQESRRYESAAQLLTDGIQLLQRIGKLTDQQEEMAQELEQLAPYRVLDLLSRDLAEEVARQQGLQMLDQLVTDRGGLEGAAFAEDSNGLSQGEFELFFQQIRRFLTAQEQLDLYQRWQRKGSMDAAFLQVMALTAAGFSRRKPERLDDARRQLNTLNVDGLDLRPLQGCLDLLLGDVERAQTRVLASADAELKQWLLKHPGDDLAALCDYCRAWLRRDVLPGFRDVDAEAVDLEAWFADRDVQAFVERLERLEGRQLNSSPLEDDLPEPSDPSPFPGFNLDAGSAVSFLGDSSIDSDVVASQSGGDLIPPALRERLSALRGWSLPRVAVAIPSLPLDGSHWRVSRRPLLIGGTVVATLVAAGALVALRGVKTTQSPTLATEPTPSIPLIEKGSPSAGPVQPPVQLQPAALMLNADQPSNEQISEFLQAWLDRKAAVLAGGSVAHARLSDVARPGLLDRVQSERRRDQASGSSQAITASIGSLRVVSVTPNRLEVRAEVNYADQRLDAAGTVVDTTSATTFPVTYVLGRDGTQWRLEAYWQIQSPRV